MAINNNNKSKNNNKNKHNKSSSSSTHSIRYTPTLPCALSLCHTLLPPFLALSAHSFCILSPSLSPSLWEFLLSHAERIEIPFIFTLAF